MIRLTNDISRVKDWIPFGISVGLASQHHPTTDSIARNLPLVGFVNSQLAESVAEGAERDAK